MINLMRKGAQINIFKIYWEKKAGRNSCIGDYTCVTFNLGH